jgi:F-type H+-transporting ATPase subunit b
MKDCWALVSVFALLLLPATAIAGGGELHHEPDLSTLLFPAINFVLYLGVMAFAYFRLVRKALHQRSVGVEDSLARSAQALAQAEEELNAAKQRLAAIEQEKAELRSDFLEQGRRLQETIRVGAEKSAAEIGRDTERRIAGELKKAKAEIREEVVSLAAKLARMRLTQELSGDEDRRLREETLSALDS